VEDSSVAILWSAESRRILSVGGKDGTFQCWDALSGAHLSTYRPLIKADENIAHTVQWRQQDPLRLWLDGAVVRLTDIVTNQDMYTLDETAISPDGIDGISWSPDGSLFATIETNYLSRTAPTLVHVHQGADGSSLSSFHPPYAQGTGTDAWIQQRPIFLAWSLDNTRLLSWGEDSLLYIWRVSTGTLLFLNRRYAQSRQVLEASMIAWSPDGNYLATAVAGTLDIWKPGDGTVVSSVPLPAGSAVFLTWSPDSQLLAMSNYSQLSILAPGRNTPLFTHNYSGGAFTIFAWSPDSRRMAGNAWVSPTDPINGNPANPLFTVWDARTGQHAVTYADSDQLGASLARLAWSPDGRYLALQRTDSVVEVWRPH
jgi:WD40 repeat protein